MFYKIANLISLLVVLIWSYTLTRNRIILWVVIYIAYFFICVITFKANYPDIQFFSPTIEYVIFLTFVGIPFLILVVLIGVEGERQKKIYHSEKLIPKIFSINVNNIIFWVLIIILNIFGLLMDKHFF